MKTVLCLAVLAFALVQAKVPDNVSTAVHHAHEACQAVPATKIDKDLQDQLFKGVYPDVPLLKAHMLCFSKHYGLQDDSGVLKNTEIKKKLLEVGTEAEVEEVIKKCVIQRETPEQTAYEMLKCWRANNIHLH